MHGIPTDVGETAGTLLVAGAAACMLKMASTTFVAVLRALLANKYVEIASMAGHCRADVSSAKSETCNPVLSDYDWQLVRTGVAVEKLICGKRTQ